MIPPFPRWIWGWAVALPFIAGSVNATALLSLRHGGVTHLTGVSTEGAIALAQGDLSLVGHALAVMGCFTFGCALSSWSVRTDRWVRSKAAAAALGAEALLLAVAGWTLDDHPAIGITLCALGIGLQNGTSSLVTGAVLRTSHLTGMFTDLGIALGQRARQAVSDSLRARVCGVVIASFVTGAAAGAACFTHWGGRAALGSAVAAAVSALWTAAGGRILRPRL